MCGLDDGPVPKTRDDMISTQRKLDLRQSYNAFIQECGPYKYALTLTFKHAQSEADYNQQVNFLLRLLNKRLYGKRNETKHLEGFAAAEVHKYFRSTVHYHFIIKDSPAFHQEGKKSFEEHLYRCSKKIKCCRTGKLTFSDKGICLKNAYNELGWINYMTKSFEFSTDTSFLQQLTVDGIDRVLW